MFVIFLITALGWVSAGFCFDETVILAGNPAGRRAIMCDDSTVDGQLRHVSVHPSGQPPGKAPARLESGGKRAVGVVMIVGGGCAIAESFKNNQYLAEWVGQELAFISQMPTLRVLLLVVRLMIFLTEINSNTATTNIFPPYWYYGGSWRHHRCC